jgi:hypothetical protein
LHERRFTKADYGRTANLSCAQLRRRNSNFRQVFLNDKFAYGVSERSVDRSAEKARNRWRDVANNHTRVNRDNHIAAIFTEQPKISELGRI